MCEGSTYRSNSDIESPTDRTDTDLATNRILCMEGKVKFFGGAHGQDFGK